MMKLLQANMHRSRIADALLEQVAAEREADVVIISEQYGRISRGAWYEDETGTAALWLPNERGLAITQHGAGCGYAYVKTGNFTLMSCYLTPSDNLEQFKAKLDLIEDRVQELDGPFVVAGDFNARAVEWGSPTTNTRGRYILDMSARLGLVVANVGNATTYRRPGCEYTTPDITLVSESLAGAIVGWNVLEDYTGSDHQYICFQITIRANTTQTQGTRGTRKWNAAKLNPRAFLANFDQASIAPTTEDASSLADAMMQRITQGCNASMPCVSRRARRQPVYWWTAEIANLRRACLRSRRRYTRARRNGEAPQEADDYRRSRKALKEAIMASKKLKWEELRSDLNGNPWGLGYRIVTGKLGAGSIFPRLNGDEIDNIVDRLFPTHPPLGEEQEPEGDGVPNPFTEQELKAAARCLKKGKAPGPDGVPSEALRLLAEDRPDALLEVYNACIAQGIFPKQWKKQKLTLISKMRGDPTQPASYRPLCMLDSAGKLLEKLLQRRLAESVEMAGGLSERQYGFRPGRSTLGAIQNVVRRFEHAQRRRYYPKRIIVLATLDVRNAFNSLRWADIMKALREKFRIPRYLTRILQSYLSDRELLYDTPGDQRVKAVTSGAAQGSILGPDLWNISYDAILNMEMPEDTHLVGYADDIAAVISARDMDDARRKLNQVMIRTQTWLEDHGLELARNKTEVILMTKAHMPLEISMQFGDMSLVTQKAVKYLGLRLDCRLTYWAQIQHAATKAAKVTGMLSRLMANIGGPTQSKRKLIMATTTSILLYGSEIWADALRAKSKRRVLEAVQRTAALRVASAYRTVSGAAVLVISGEIPVDLLARERKEAWDSREDSAGGAIGATERRFRTIQRWQGRWNEEMTGRWTARLIPSVESWIQRNFGEVNYFLTQFLSGHGYFRKYLHRMGKVDDPGCIYCETPNDDAEHTFFNCTRWHAERDALREQIGEFTPADIINKMLQREDSWNAVRRYVECVLRNKKRDLDTVQAEASNNRDIRRRANSMMLAANVAVPDVGE